MGVEIVEVFSAIELEFCKMFSNTCLIDTHNGSEHFDIHQGYEHVKGSLMARENP